MKRVLVAACAAVFAACISAPSPVLVVPKSPVAVEPPLHVAQCSGPATSLPDSLARDLPARTRKQNVDDVWADLARTTPGGFGGMFVDSTHTGVLWLTQPALATEAVQALSKRNTLPFVNPTVREGRWTFAQLVEWSEYLAGRVRGVALADNDESVNRIRLGALSIAGRDSILASLAVLPLPCDLIVVDLSGFVAELVDRPNTSYVAGAAAAARNAKGEFMLASPALDADEIDRARAGELVDAYMATFGRSMSALWSRNRGAAVDATSLKQCGRVFYAESPVGLPADATGDFVRTAGPHWLVTLCGGSQSEVSIAVSTHAGDVLVKDGLIASNPAGNDFFPLAIPVRSVEMPDAPERAVAFASQQTGARVIALPALVQPYPPLAPQFAAWRVVLDRAVTVRAASGKSTTTSELFVGLDPQKATLALLVSDTTTPRMHAMRILPPFGDGRVMEFIAKPNFPKAFVPVQVVR